MEKTDLLRTLLSDHNDIAEELSPDPGLLDILNHSKENLVFVIHLASTDTEHRNIVEFIFRLLEFDEKINYYFSSYDNSRLKFFNDSNHDCVQFFYRGNLSNIITFENIAPYVRHKIENDFIKNVKRKFNKKNENNSNKKIIKSRKYLIEHLKIKEGCVYVLESPSAPDILKIGYTNQKLNTRIAQIKNGTGVLPDLDCVAVYETEYASLLEADIHMKFNNNRIGGNREFFSIPLPSISSYIENKNCANIYLYNKNTNSFEFFPKTGNIKKFHKTNQVQETNDISINGLKILNIKNLNVISSKNNNEITHEIFEKPKIKITPGNQTTTTPALSRGSHQDDVLRLHGTPTDITSYDSLGFEEWSYGRSKVKIDTRTRQVLEWRNNGDLRIDFLPGNQTTNTPAFSRSSHQDDVLRLQGTPTDITSYDSLGFEEWSYGHSKVKIDTRTRQVLEWRNNGDLRIDFLPGNQTTNTPAFSRSSHQDDVLRLQGTPTDITSYDSLGFEEWSYGRSKVKIDTRTRQILEWRNNGDLRIDFLPGNQTTNTPAFSRSSHQDDVLRLQGTPTDITSYDSLGFEEWSYGRSKVKIDTRTRQVLEWRNNGELKCN